MIARSASVAVRASARPVVAPAARLATQQQRFASNGGSSDSDSRQKADARPLAVQDPKERAASLIDSLPGNSVVSKTLYITLGTGGVSTGHIRPGLTPPATAYALTNEIFIVNAECA